MNRNRVNLEGMWDFSIPGGRMETRKVPGSYHCVGDSVYSREFTVECGANRRVLLCFEGICYEGVLVVNGVEFAVMLPYSTYKFDITGILAPVNSICLYLKDINASYGPAEGWRNYGGIIRAVYLEVVPETYIEDIFFHALLQDEYQTARCTTDVRLAGTHACDCSICVDTALMLNGDTVASCRSAVTGGQAAIAFDVDCPQLWSPDNPILYDLKITMGDDIWEQKVGFKSFEAMGNRFTLNGRPIFLAGVCRHDLWSDPYGFTQSDEQIEQDMRMIKCLGANYVRLVHYPHDKRVIEAADRLGLMVSCEPGLWGADLDNPNTAAGALAVMEKVVLRDRSNVSVIFWLTFNECRFANGYLHDVITLVRRLDPTRMISGANVMDIHGTKETFDRLGFDFYTFHPYGSEPGHVIEGLPDLKDTTLRNIAATLSAKPLVFTEWGGFFVNNNPALFAWFCREMVDLYLYASVDCALAGISYWSWSDYYEANRLGSGCVDGVETEGLVTIERECKVNYDTYAKAIAGIHRDEAIRPEVVLSIAGVPGKIYEPIMLPATDTAGQQRAWDAAWDASIPMPGMLHKKQRTITHGPVMPEPVTKLGALDVSIRAGRPLVVSAVSGAVEIPVNASADTLFFIGQALFSHGYPIDGAKSERFGCYEIVYADGSVQEVLLRNGCEATTVQGTWGSSVIDPRGTGITPLIQLSYDKTFEIYHLNLLTLTVDSVKEVTRIVARVELPNYALLLYGITAGK